MTTNRLTVSGLSTCFPTEDGLVRSVDRKSTRLNSSH